MDSHAERRSGADRRTIIQAGPLDSKQGRSGMGILVAAWAVALALPLLAGTVGRGGISAVANLGIFMGYLFVGVFVAPFVRTSYLATKAAGAVFFMTCGLTHLHKFFAIIDGHDIDQHTYVHATIHTVQVVAVFGFVIGLWWEFVRGSEWPPRLDFARMFGRGDPNA